MFAGKNSTHLNDIRKILRQYNPQFSGSQPGCRQIVLEIPNLLPKTLQF